MKFNGPTLQRILRLARSVYDEYQRSQQDSEQGSGQDAERRAPRRTPAPGVPRRRNDAARTGTSAGSGYVGDYTGAVRPEYAPDPDGRPDPGEIVWTWVPFQEDPSQGKDRPVLLVGRDGGRLLAVMLTSKDHTNRDHRDHRYLDIGSGPWDRQGRASEIRVDRILRIDPEAVRREGAVMDRATFERVVAAVNAR